MNTIETKIQLAPGARMPEYATPGASCMDCYAHLIKIHTMAKRDLLSFCGSLATPVERTVELHDNESLKNIGGSVDMVTIDPGFALELPEGYAIKAFANSRFAKAGWRLANGVGVIDNDYRGHIKFIYVPGPNAKPFHEVFSIGGVCGQIEPCQRFHMQLNSVSTLTPTQRGEGGFGSTEQKGDAE